MEENKIENTGKSQLVYVNKTIIEYEDKLFELTKAALTGMSTKTYDLQESKIIAKKAILVAKEVLKQLNEEKI